MTGEQKVPSPPDTERELVLLFESIVVDGFRLRSLPQLATAYNPKLDDFDEIDPR